MPTFQERVIDEKHQLDEKRAKLFQFLASLTFKELTPKERDLLARQYNVMCEYSDILRERIQTFKDV